MSVKRVSLRYARSIYHLAKEHSIEDNVFNDFIFINNTIESSRELELLINSPVVQHEVKKKILTEIFDGRVNDLTLKFLQLLADKGRDRLIDDISQAFVVIYNEEKNRLPVEIYSTIELDESTKEKINKELANWTNKTILPDFKLDEGLKGGLKIKVDNLVFDTSLKNQLEKLREVLAG